LSEDLGKKLRKHLADVKSAKSKIKEKYDLSKEVMDIANALSYGVAWQDERKKYIFIHLHFEDLFLREVARRKGYKLSDLQNASALEVIRSLKEDIGSVLQKRKKGFGFFCYAGKMKELDSLLIADYWKQYKKEDIKPEDGLIKGIVVSRGKNGFAKGRVRIVNDPFAASNFKKGDILVAPMTTPEYIFLMRKSSAIITDTGGLTSHAAIVSRELGIPCIVGTKIATQVLKDDDLVEVDASQGTVKLLSK